MTESMKSFLSFNIIGSIKKKKKLMAIEDDDDSRSIKKK